MPPKTRRAGHGPTAAQSKLSFNNRITKPSDSSLTKSTKSKLNEPAQEIVTSEIAKQATPEPEVDSPQTTTKSSSGKNAIQKKTEPDSPVRIIPSPSRQKSKRRARRSLNDEEEDTSFEAAEKQATKITEAQVKKYWKAEEDSRSAPRVHQEKLPMYEKILRHFDLSSEYGPCIGITRLQRWKRAQSLSLNPPIEVLSVLLKEDAKDAEVALKKKGAEKRVTGRIAYVDELGGAREEGV